MVFLWMDYYYDRKILCKDRRALRLSFFRTVRADHTPICGTLDTLWKPLDPVWHSESHPIAMKAASFCVRP